MIVPLNDFVLIKLPSETAEETTTSFGIVLLERKVDEKKNRGTIQSVGDKVEFLKEGDEVLYEKWGGTIFDFDSDKYILIQAKAILAKII